MSLTGASFPFMVGDHRNLRPYQIEASAQYVYAYAEFFGEDALRDFPAERTPGDVGVFRFQILYGADRTDEISGCKKPPEATYAMTHYARRYSHHPRNGHDRLAVNENRLYEIPVAPVEKLRPAHKDGVRPRKTTRAT